MLQVWRCGYQENLLFVLIKFSQISMESLHEKEGGAEAPFTPIVAPIDSDHIDREGHTMGDHSPTYIVQTS